MRYSLLIEYDGSNYSGWQIQKNENTIQGKIEDALEVTLKSKTGIIGAGRTDAGVHAKGQVAHFDTYTEINNEKTKRSLNGILPVDIRIIECNKVTKDFHARYSAKERKYKYYISQNPTAFYRLYSWQFYSELKITHMQTAADTILGKHDFKSFCRNISEVQHHFCTINSISWQQNKNLIKFEIAADRFLHGMVRALVGTFVDIGTGKITNNEFIRILNAGDRTRAGQAAPAKGLFLETVKY